MALLSSFGSNSSGGLRSKKKKNSESWADFHKKHRSRPTYVGSSANKRRADLSSGMGRRASMGSGSGGTAGSRIFGSDGSSSNFDRRGSLSNGSQRRRSSMY